MKAIVCEMCGSNDVVKQDGNYVCQHCGTKYSVEEAKKLMIEGTVEIQGTVKVDNTSFVQKSLANARRAKQKEDWEETEKYYNMVEQYEPNNIEAIFYSAYGKVRRALTVADFNAQQTSIKILDKSISIIDDNFELTTFDDNRVIIEHMVEDVIGLNSVSMVAATAIDNPNQYINEHQNRSDIKKLRSTMTESLNNILSKIPSNDQEKRETIQNSIAKLKEPVAEKSGGCYVATAVYGSYDCPQVWTLRRFRDDKLAKNWYGRAFIYTYYAISPRLVKWLGEATWFKNLWRPTLDKMVMALKEMGLEDTPYQDKQW